MTILRVDSSANTETSVTRGLTDRIIKTLGDTDVTVRDLAKEALPQITQTWALARTVAKEERTNEQAAILAQSDALIAEIIAADSIVIGAPVYNFSVPASLKAWIDLIARAGVTFRYSEDGPAGMISGKRVIIALASGGTPVGSDMDFASGYLRHVLGFMGMTDVTFVAADALAKDADGTMARAHEQIDALSKAA